MRSQVFFVWYPENIMDVYSTKLKRTFAQIAIGVTLSPFEIVYSIQYSIHHIFSPTRNQWIPTCSVHEYWNIKQLYESIPYIHVVIASFTPSDISLDWIWFMINEIMTFHCKGLYEDAPYISSVYVWYRFIHLFNVSIFMHKTCRYSLISCWRKNMVYAVLYTIYYFKRTQGYSNGYSVQTLSSTWWNTRP